ncbi:transposable element Tcb1 transposase [Trichonephila clavipes]|nr:transposable element Tcb1 transposase [Trichonephila clavipes]
MKDIAFTDESHFCLQPHDSRIRVWRHHGEKLLNCCVMHHHTDPASGIMRLLLAILQQDNSRLHVARDVQEFFIHQIEQHPCLLVLPIYRQSKTCGSCFHSDWTGIHHPLLHEINLTIYVSHIGAAVPQGCIQSFFDSLLRCMAVVKAKNGGYTNY